jgi:hypothetical protein
MRARQIVSISSAVSVARASSTVSRISRPRSAGAARRSGAMADPARARELLARHMPPLVLMPDGRSYRVTGGFNLSVCLDEGHDQPGAPTESAIIRVGGTPYGRFRIPSGYRFRVSARVSGRQVRAEGRPFMAARSPPYRHFRRPRWQLGILDIIALGIAVARCGSNGRRCAGCGMVGLYAHTWRGTWRGWQRSRSSSAWSKVREGTFVSWPRFPEWTSRKRSCPD